jgi:hypothetical protein
VFGGNSGVHRLRDVAHQISVSPILEPSASATAAHHLGTFAAAARTATTA